MERASSPSLLMGDSPSRRTACFKPVSRIASSGQAGCLSSIHCNALLIVVFFLFVSLATAGIPPGYYDGTEGLTDSALILKLRQITSNGHISKSYSNASDHMFVIDANAQGQVRCVYTGR